MPKATQSVQKDIRNRPLAYIVQVVGLVVIILNLWLASKLAPLSERIALNTQQIAKAAEDVSKISLEHEGLATKGDLLDIQSRLIRIEDILLGR